MNKLLGFILGFLLVLVCWFVFGALATSFNVTDYTLFNLVFFLCVFLLLLFLWFKFKPLFIGALICAVLTLGSSWLITGFYNNMYKTSGGNANTVTPSAPK